MRRRGGRERRVAARFLRAGRASRSVWSQSPWPCLSLVRNAARLGPDSRCDPPSRPRRLARAWSSSGFCRRTRRAAGALDSSRRSFARASRDGRTRRVSVLTGLTGAVVRRAVAAIALCASRFAAQRDVSLRALHLSAPPPRIPPCAGRRAAGCGAAENDRGAGHAKHTRPAPRPWCGRDAALRTRPRCGFAR